MLHVQFTGSHYEIGLQLGRTLARRGQHILDQVPFPLTGERLAFARICLPLYRNWFPGALEELRGLAEGQSCSAEALAGVVLSMYAIPPGEPHCSCFALRNGGASSLAGTATFFPHWRPSIPTFCYTLPTAGSPSWEHHLLPPDGGRCQRAGLAVGLTSVPPGGPPRPGLSAGMALRLLLESCRTVGEGLTLLARLPWASSHTLVLADRTGEVALAECCPERTALSHPEGETTCVCAVNAFHLPQMAPYRREMADDWRAEERYGTLTRALSRQGPAMGVQQGADLLAGRLGFLCQYERTRGQDTVWSVLWDGGRLWRAEGNPSRVPFQEDRRLTRQV